MAMSKIDEYCVKSIQQFVPDTSKNPGWINADRFVLSNGHACALLYTMIHLKGYGLTVEDLKGFRQLGSPLGQGISNAVGMAIASTNLAATYNKPGFEIFNSKIFCLLGDGCMQEGVQAEAVSLAGHLKLGNLIALYDDNNVQIDGDTNLAFTEDVIGRFEALGWHTQCVDDFKDLSSIKNSIKKALEVKDKPSLIKIKTIIGVGSKNQGTEKVHGAPLGSDDIANVKKNLGFDPEKSFYIPKEVYDHYSKVNKECEEAEKQWCDLMKKYKDAYPHEYMEITRVLSKKMPENFFNALPKFTPADPAQATRKFSEGVINKIASTVSEFIGGSADLTPSNLTKWKGSVDFQHDSSKLGSYKGKYIRFGVREHGMAAICNGISGFGFHIPFGATFLNFIGYALGAVRLSALSKHHVIYIGTHDSIGLGEDGPTHQPIEIMAVLRAMPNLTTYRPADGNEVSACYALALTNNCGPSVLALSRQNVPNLHGSTFENAMKGGYVLCEIGESAEKLDVIIVSTGTEVHICVEAAKIIAEDGLLVRVVSLPSWEIFLKNDAEYKKSVFIPGVPVVSVEALSTFGWSKFAHMSIGIDTFGESGKYADLYKHFGLVPEEIAKKVKHVAKVYKNKSAEIKLGVNHCC